METLLRTHRSVELLHQMQGLPERRRTHGGARVTAGGWSKRVCAIASRGALLELLPEMKKEKLDFELPKYDHSMGKTLDLAVLVAEQGLSVCCIDPSPQIIWPNNYGVWVDEFAAMDLLDCLDTTWPPPSSICVSHGVTFHQAKVVKVTHGEFSSSLLCSDGAAVAARLVLDATGFSRCLVQYDKPYNPVEEHPFELDKMLFMDWRDSHLAGKKELKEKNGKETSLVARPGLQMEDIQERMVARLRHLGIRVKSIEEDERCVIPMGGPLPVLPQRVLGIGGTAGMVHPSTGYMVARTLAAAPVVASSIELWPIERRRQREFFCFGMDILLKLDLQGTRRFFDAFFDLEPRYWHGFLSSRLFLPELVFFGLSLFSQASNVSKLEIMAKGTLPW
ncbi:unnamed protein product [Spirodela intermedia]|uniref:lycopene beta-cyclase n=1 Tax=Spirodela intermedia TaxID=51605 RepID=A0A7I8JKL6_SPIIN|nr:unnamed protein product [Spirodela intermedia]CAA6670704.1 unnamed protein product [Spirodela intermedia]